MEQSACRHLAEAAPQYFRHADLSVSRRDDEIMRIHQGQGAAETITVNLCDGYLWKISDRLEHNGRRAEFVPICRRTLAL
jgi:hypothetical protein